MSNNISHYFGAYLEIHCKKTEVATNETRSCPNSCGVFEAASFCPKCGAKMRIATKTEKKYPTLIVDHLLDDDWEDELHNVTPPHLFQSGLMLAVSNVCDDGEWMSLDNSWPNGIKQVVDFPTSKEIEKMKQKFIDAHREVIDALEDSPAVIAVVVKAGYVFDAEY